MVVRRILLDEHLLLNLLFGRPLPHHQGELLWDLLIERRITGFLTDFAVDHALGYAMRLHGPTTARRLQSQLYNLFVCCSVPSTVVRAIEESELAMPFSIQAAIAAQLELDGIVTNRPLDYAHSMEFDDALVYTPGQLLAEYYQDNLFENCAELENQYTYHYPLAVRDQLGQLEHIEVCCGGTHPVAKVTLQTPTGQVYEETASGVGPVDATFRAINLAVNRFVPVSDVQMVYYRSLATTADSEVSAMVLLQRSMSLSPGRGFHPDIMMASAQAYMDALGYLLYCESRLEL